MQELIIAGVSFVLGATSTMIMFRWGAKWAVDLVYKIKEDVPLEQIGRPYESDFNETD